MISFRRRFECPVVLFFHVHSPWTRFIELGRANFALVRAFTCNYKGIETWGALREATEHLPVCIRVCETQSLRWLKDRLQYWHWYGRSPVWMRRWFFIVLSAVNRKGQYSQAYLRSPVWMRRCFVWRKKWDQHYRILLNFAFETRTSASEELFGLCSRFVLPLSWKLWIPYRKHHTRMDGHRRECADANSIRLCSQTFSGTRHIDTVSFGCGASCVVSSWHSGRILCHKLSTKTDARHYAFVCGPWIPIALWMLELSIGKLEFRTADCGRFTFRAMRAFVLFLSTRVFGKFALFFDAMHSMDVSPYVTFGGVNAFANIALERLFHTLFRIAMHI